MRKSSSLIRRGSKLRRLLWTPYGRAGLMHGIGASVEHEQALSAFSFQTIVDIGANKGQFTLFCLDHFPEAKIHAFEPLAAPARRYRRAIPNNPRVNLHEVAIGPDTGTAEIHISKRIDSSSLLPIGDLQSLIFPGTAEIAIETINIGRLNCFLSSADIRNPALLKIDVQGFEYEVLRGCSELLGLFSHIYVECSYVTLYEGQHLVSDIVQYLNRSDFELLNRFNMIIDRTIGPIQADFLFGRKTHPIRGGDDSTSNN